jgi:hypothetical protein
MNSPDPCCIELEKLPEFAIPQAPLASLPAILAELLVSVFFEPTSGDAEPRVFYASESIRGPTTPAAYRAVLGVWRL